MMLAGLRSRWRIPLLCAPSSAPAICIARRSASSAGKGPRIGVALDVLQHQIVRADVVDLADVRMVERGDRARFLVEAVGVARP